MRAGEIVGLPESMRSLEKPQGGVETEGATTGRVGPWDDLRVVLRSLKCLLKKRDHVGNSCDLLMSNGQVNDIDQRVCENRGIWLISCGLEVKSKGTQIVQGRRSVGHSKKHNGGISKNFSSCIAVSGLQRNHPCSG